MSIFILKQASPSLLQLCALHGPMFFFVDRQTGGPQFHAPARRKLAQYILSLTRRVESLVTPETEYLLCGTYSRGPLWPPTIYWFCMSLCLRVIS